MAILLRPDGTTTETRPTDGRAFTLPELYRHLECETVELVRLTDGRAMYVDEDGKARRPGEVNPQATTLFHEAGGLPWDVVVGPALVCTPLEAGELEGGPRVRPGLRLESDGTIPGTQIYLPDGSRLTGVTEIVWRATAPHEPTIELTIRSRHAPGLALQGVVDAVTVICERCDRPIAQEPPF